MSSVYNQSVNNKTVHHNTHQTSIVKIVLLNHNESQMKSEDNEVVMITGNGSKLSTLSSDHCSDRTRVGVVLALSLWSRALRKLAKQNLWRKSKTNRKTA